VPSYGKKLALDHIYGSLIHAYTHHQNVEDVDRLVQERVDVGGSPSLGILATLLDAYRRTFDIDGAKQVWPEIFRRGLQYSRSGPLFKDEEDDPSSGRLRGNILCIPLSIYIDTLSTAGLHTEIAALWKQVQEHGFTFDSHNWNHLTVALVRAGEVEHAFSIVEKVILPYQRQSQIIRQNRDPSPESPLSFNAPPDNDDDPVTEASAPPMHLARERVIASARLTKKLGMNPEMASLEHEDDLCRPLHVLHQISPAWNVWRPHGAALSALLATLSTLRSGRIPKPIGSQATTEEDENFDPSEAAQARDLLNKLWANYPDTIRMVEYHEVRERRRLGADYDKAYNWR